MFRVEKKKKELYYKGVAHVTFNPETQGVVRVHLIPPKYTVFSVKPAVIIVNGNYILPIRSGWYILLYHYLEEVNKIGKRYFNKDESSLVVKNTISRTREVYKNVTEAELYEDLKKILNTLNGIGTNNLKKYEGDYLKLKDYSAYMTAPHRIDLMISAMTKNNEWNCTNNCLHCYAAGQFQSGQKELDTAKWKEVIDICRKNRVPQLTFTGGEPTMRKDLAELIEYSSWFITRLNTNGTLLTAELCEKLLKASLDNIQITLYSNEGSIHNILVGAETFAKTEEGIKNALKAGLDVSINTPLCALNKNYIATLEYLNNLGVKYVTCSGIIKSGNAKNENSKLAALLPDELEEILKQAKTFCKKNGMDINFTLPGCVEEQKLKNIGFVPPMCGACLSNMAIAPDGSVMPCQSWLDENSNLGNILNTDWKKIWNNSLCKSIRRKKENALNKCLLPSRRTNK